MKILLIFVFILLAIFQSIKSINLNKENFIVEIKDIKRLNNIKLTVL